MDEASDDGPVRVLRGRAADLSADLAVTDALAADTRDTGRPAVRAWTPHRHVSFGRRDARADGYEAARAAARSHGFPPAERSTGGRAVAYTGTTAAFVYCEPLADLREGVQTRYDAAVGACEGALAGLGAAVKRGEPPNSYCPGSHSLSAVGDGKVVGVAQRVQRGVARTGGIVVVRDRRELAAVFADVYAALGVPFDPETVGSVAAAGGPDDPKRVVRALEDALVGDRERTVERVTDGGG